MQICQARAWILSTGFTLAFGAMFSKVWRVHRFTTKAKTDPKVGMNFGCLYRDGNVKLSLEQIPLISQSFNLVIILFSLVCVRIEKSRAMETVHDGVGFVGSGFGDSVNMANPRSTRAKTRNISTGRADTG